MTILENKKLDSNHAQNDNLSKTKSFSKTNSNDPMNITIFIGNSDIQAGLDEFWNSKHDDYARLNNLKPSVNTCKTTGSLVTTNKSQISGKGLRFAISFSGRNSRNSRNSRKSGKDGAVSTRSGSIKNYNKRKISEATVNSVSATASHVGMASSTANTATSVRTIFTDKCCTCILCCFKIDNADNLSLNELSQLNDTDEEGDLTNLDVKERKQSQAPEKKRSLLESDNQQITTTLSEILGRGNFELCHEEVCQELDLNLEECLAWEEKFSNLMSSSKGKELFKTYCKSEFSNENIEFYLALDRFIIILNNTNTTTSEFVTLLQEIYNNFISDESPFQVSLTYGIQKELSQLFYDYKALDEDRQENKKPVIDTTTSEVNDVETIPIKEPRQSNLSCQSVKSLRNPVNHQETKQILHRVQQYVYNVMAKDSYVRFQNSELMKNIIAYLQ